ncbi:MAG: DUF2007 domain-containing protein [Phycisphaerae bacterium]|nr:DUF2007 domain-containing protein [Phycisphaerae bacterium]
MARSRKRNEDADAVPPEKPEKGKADGDGTMTELVTVVQAPNLKEAQMMKSILESAEIPAFIGDDDTSGTGLRGVPVLVPEDLAGQAAEILADAAMDDEEFMDDDIDEEDDDFDEEWDDEDEDDLFDEDDDFDDLDDDDGEGLDDLDDVEDDDL